MDTAIAERKPLTIVVTNAVRGPGLAVIRKLTAAGHNVCGVTGSTAGAAKVRTAGGLPVFADELRGSELGAVVKMAKADVLVDLARQDLNQTLQNAAWDADELVARARAVAQAARESGVKFLVATSYAFVYGAQNGNAVDESVKPVTGGHPLLRAALKAERVALNSGIPACVLRFGYLYGPDMPQLQAVVPTLLRGRPLPSGAGIANYVFADDVAEAIRRAAEAQIADQIINVTDGDPITSGDFLAAIATGMGMQPPGKLPRFLNGLIAGRPLNDLFKLSARVSNEKAKAELGWSPHYKLNAGLAETLLTWRAEA